MLELMDRSTKVLCVFFCTLAGTQVLASSSTTQAKANPVAPLVVPLFFQTQDSQMARLDPIWVKESGFVRKKIDELGVNKSTARKYAVALSMQDVTDITELLKQKNERTIRATLTQLVTMPEIGASSSSSEPSYATLRRAIQVYEAFEYLELASLMPSCEEIVRNLFMSDGTVKAFSTNPKFLETLGLSSGQLTHRGFSLLSQDDQEYLRACLYEDIEIFGPLSCVSINPRSDYLIGAGLDGKKGFIVGVETSGAKRIKRFEFKEPIEQVCWCGNTQIIVRMSSCLKVWDISEDADVTPKWWGRVGLEALEKTWAVAVSQDLSHVALGADEKIFLIDMVNKSVKSLSAMGDKEGKTHKKKHESKIVFTGKDKILVEMRSSGDLLFYDGKTGLCLAHEKGDDTEVLHYYVNDKSLITFSAGNSANVWDCQQSAQRRNLQKGRMLNDSMVFVSYGQQVSVVPEQALSIYDTKGKAFIEEMPFLTGTNVADVLLPKKNALHLTTKNKKVLELPITEAPKYLCSTYDGAYLFGIGTKNRLRLWYYFDPKLKEYLARGMTVAQLLAVKTLVNVVRGFSEKAFERWTPQDLSRVHIQQIIRGLDDSFLTLCSQAFPGLDLIPKSPDTKSSSVQARPESSAGKKSFVTRFLSLKRDVKPPAPAAVSEPQSPRLVRRKDEESHHDESSSWSDEKSPRLPKDEAAFSDAEDDDDPLDSEEGIRVQSSGATQSTSTRSSHSKKSSEHSSSRRRKKKPSKKSSTASASQSIHEGDTDSHRSKKERKSDRSEASHSSRRRRHSKPSLNDEKKPTVSSVVSPRGSAHELTADRDRNESSGNYAVTLPHGTKQTTHLDKSLETPLSPRSRSQTSDGGAESSAAAAPFLVKSRQIGLRTSLRAPSKPQEASAEPEQVSPRARAVSFDSNAPKVLNTALKLSRGQVVEARQDLTPQAVLVVSLPKALSSERPLKVVSPNEKPYNQGVTLYNDGNYTQAYEVFSRIAQDDKDTAYKAVAYYWLGQMYLYGQGVPPNFKEARTCFTQSSRQKVNSKITALSYLRLGEIYYYAQGVERSSAIARDYFERVLECPTKTVEAELPALFLLRRMRRSIFGCDKAEGATYLKRLQELCFETSQNNDIDPIVLLYRGRLYLAEGSASGQPERAQECFAQVTNSNAPDRLKAEAWYRMGKLRCNDSREQALNYFQQAALQTTNLWVKADAQLSIGHLNLSGIGTQKGSAALQAMNQYENAYRQSNNTFAKVRATYALARLFETGQEGVKADPAKVVTYDTEAAGQSCCDKTRILACYSLSMQYYRGTKAVKKNLLHALKFFKKVALESQDNALLQEVWIRMADLYRTGEVGIEKDTQLAHDYYHKVFTLGINRQYVHKALCYLGEHELKGEDFAKAKEYLEDAQERNDDEAIKKMAAQLLKTLHEKQLVRDDDDND